MNNKKKEFIKCKSYEIGIKVIVEEWDITFGWKKIDMSIDEYFENYENDNDYRVVSIWSN